MNLALRTLEAYALIFIVPLVLPLAFIKLIGLGGLRDIVTFEPGTTALHTIDPRLKLLYPTAFGILTILLNSRFMLYVFLLSLIPWIMLRPSRTRIRVLMTLAIVPAVGMVWSQGMFYLPNHPHFLVKFPWTMTWFGSPGITTYGLSYGFSQTSRVLVAVSTSMIILLTTDVSDFIWAFERFRAPPRAGFALTAALRFMPELLARTTLLLQAIQLRGYDLSLPGWRHPGQWLPFAKRVVNATVLITVPLLIGVLRNTSTMAMVADARGFGANKRRTSVREHQRSTADILGYGILATLVVGAFVLNELHIGNRQFG
ncbi:MAG: energy-coupling factor transporter transmembrane protein EcfT [Conexibacteraceae bacterium]|nr:energy-coupling factor transporter transmembrane protein EcfT [Conexibacteraceae bacterium]